MSNGDPARCTTGIWKFSVVFLLLFFGSVEAFHIYKLKKLIAAYALAKAFSGKRPSTTVIPIPIPIPLPVQQNEIIKIPSHSSGKAYVTTVGGRLHHGIGHSLHGGGAYKLATLHKSSRHQGIRSMNRLNGEGSVIGLGGDDGGYSLGGLNSHGGAAPQIIFTGGGGSSFGYGGHTEFSHGYDMDYQPDFASSNMYRGRKVRGYRRPYLPKGRRIRSHRYPDFSDDSERFIRGGRKSRRCRTRSSCGHRPEPPDDGPIPVGEVYGAKY